MGNCVWVQVPPSAPQGIIGESDAAEVVATVPEGLGEASVADRVARELRRACAAALGLLDAGDLDGVREVLREVLRRS